MEDILSLLQVALGGLDERNSVLDVSLRLIQASDLTPHLLRYGETSGIITCTVDPHSGRELLDVALDLLVPEAEGPLSELGAHIVVDYHMPSLSKYSKASLAFSL
jgi:hypothetical protein